MSTTFTPNAERALRKALTQAHDTDLVNEAFRVIGREKSELRARTNKTARPSLIESIIAQLSGSYEKEVRDRQRVIDRLAKAASKRSAKR